jgi:hypothetical protein
LTVSIVLQIPQMTGTPLITLARDSIGQHFPWVGFLIGLDFRVHSAPATTGLIDLVGRLQVTGGRAPGLVVVPSLPSQDHTEAA